MQNETNIPWEKSRRQNSLRHSLLPIHTLRRATIIPAFNAIFGRGLVYGVLTGAGGMFGSRRPIGRTGGGVQLCSFADAEYEVEIRQPVLATDHQQQF